MRWAVVTLTAALVAGCAAAPPPPNPETILFGFDTEPFDVDGIETAARTTRTVQATGAGAVEIAGHADTVGDPRYNLRLAERRARFTRGELIARGVPSAAISVTSLGETDLAVPTGDNVREVENRRVTLAIGGDGAFPPPVEDRPIVFPLPTAPAVD
jgi:outer membrane protein OmpA-like peptidoglycan-associated protein